jgi:hypothetical protein
MTTDASCENCLRCASFAGAEGQAPQSPNFVTAMLVINGAADKTSARRHVSHLFRVFHETANAVQGDGPGTELMSMLKEIGVHPKKKCKCRLLSRAMNKLGVVGCRANRPRLLKAMRKNFRHYRWWEILRAVMALAKSDLGKRISKTSPLEWLFDEAIRRAEAKGYK